MGKDIVVLYPSSVKTHLIGMVELARLLTHHHPSISVTIILMSLPQGSPSALSMDQAYIDQLILSNPSITFIRLPPPPPLASPVHPSSSLEIEAWFFELPHLNNQNLYQALLAISESANLRALVIDFFCNMTALDVSSKLSIPTYYFSTFGACDTAALLYLPNVHRNLNSERLKDGNLDILVEYPGIPPVPFKDLPLSAQDTSHRVHQYFVDTAVQMAKSSGIIVNTFEAFEERGIEAILQGKCSPGQPSVPPIFCVGPLVSDGDAKKVSNRSTSTFGEENVISKEEEHDKCLTWLDSQPSRSVVFLCFGSMGVFSKRQLKEMAIGLERSGVRFLWVVRDPIPETTQTLTLSKPTELESLLPDGFLDRTKERGLVVRMWAPQIMVLNHGSVGGFVTHCGWNSVIEAVSAAVPMLAWPLYSEQKMNRVFLVEEMKVALAVKESEDGFVSAQELEERVKELMKSEKGKAIREKVMAMREGAAKAMADGGSSRIALAKLVDYFKQH